MALSVGIVGLPNAGKSTLFNALASRRLAETAPRAFTTIDPHEAVVPLPDEKLDELWRIITSQTDDVRSVKKIPAIVTFIDIAGLVKGAHKGEGLGNQFLAKIREIDAIVHVVGAFYNPDVVRDDLHFELGSLEQIIEDVEIINIELELGGIEKKPTIIVLNVGENDVNSQATKDLIIAVTKKFKTDTVAVSAKIEEELIDFTLEERLAYLIQSGITETGLERLIKYAYQLLNLITFYTVKGGKEITAWSLPDGSRVLEAAEKVHTDFAKNFIKAQVINVDELVKLGSWKTAKEKGKIRLEGKDYIVENEDTIEFIVQK